MNNNNFWEIEWDYNPPRLYATQGGSSGSPLLDHTTRRVIVQLYGKCNALDNIFCSNLQNIYGKFSVSWGDNNSFSYNRLKDWLNPFGSDTIMYLDGKEAAYHKVSFNGNNQIIVNETAIFTVVNPPNNYQWASSGNLELINVQGNQATFVATWLGTGWVSIKVKDWEVRRHSVTISNPPLPTISRLRGSGDVCYDGSQFELLYAPSGTISWTVAAPFTFSPSSNLTSITADKPTVYRRGTGTGSATLKAFENGAEVANPKTITPSSPIIISGPATVNHGQTANFSATNWKPGYWWDSNVLNMDTPNIYQTTATTKGVGSGWVRVMLGANELVTFSVTVPPSVISGPDVVCHGQNAYSSASYWLPGMSWDAGNNYYFQIVGASTNNIVEINKTSSWIGTGWVRILYNGVQVSSRNIWANEPVILELSGPDYAFTTTPQTYHVILQNPQSYTYFDWTVDGGNYSINISGNTSQITFWDVSWWGPPVPYDITVTAINSCGESNQAFMSINSSHSPSPLTFYPNPVSDILNVEFNQEMVASRQGANLSFDVRLYDSQGNILRQANTTEGAVQFSVSTLPNGIYYLHIYDGLNSTPEIRQVVER